MNLPDQYFACGITSRPAPFESSHELTLQQYRRDLEAEIRGLADRARLVVVEVSSLYNNYQALPPGACDNAIITRVALTARRWMTSRIKRQCPRRSSGVRTSLRMVWGRFHRDGGRPGYHQHWIVDQDTYIWLGDRSTSSYDALLACIEQAWAHEQCLAGRAPDTVCLVPHDRFYVTAKAAGCEAVMSSLRLATAGVMKSRSLVWQGWKTQNHSVAL